MKEDHVPRENIIDLAKRCLAERKDTRTEINDVTDAINYFTNVHRSMSLDMLLSFRAALKEQIQIDALTDPEHVPVFYEAEFDGYGDSGEVHASTGRESVNVLLEECVRLYVNFDWYNNEGGGGDITWDVNTDTITINGYKRVVNDEAMMDDEEF